ncbi:MAG: cupin domain-containing protein [Acidobacteriota bacterium]|nr:cupin domain-containing protein [Acidobacteriota bacterium]
MPLRPILLTTAWLLVLPTLATTAQAPAAEPPAENPTQGAPPASPSPTMEAKAAADLVFVDDQAGKVWNIFGLKIVGKIFSDETGGQYSVIVSNVPPGGGPPRHVHQHEDELFYVLRGDFEFFSGDTTVRASKGALLSLPRGLPHGFRNVGEEPGVLINTISPGGFEAFFEAIDQLPKDQPLDRAQVEAIGAEYGLRFVKPQ